MKFTDEKAWERAVEINDAPYGKATIDYTRRWAELMEVKIGEGYALEEIARSTSHEADTEGITGFMYGAAVSTLAGCWKHGEELRRWHNVETQLGDEGERANQSGGVLNPALLCISTED